MKILTGEVMSGNSYLLKSVVYENFLKKAYNGQITFRHGVDKEFMKLLIEAESGVFSLKNVMSYQMQLKRVKKYMLMAVEKLIMNEENEEKLRRLRYIKKRINAARNSSQLLNLCSEGLKVSTESAMA